MSLFVKTLLEYPEIFLKTCTQLMQQKNAEAFEDFGLDIGTICSALEHLDFKNYDHVNVAKDFLDTFLWKSYSLQDHQSVALAVESAYKKSKDYSRITFDHFEAQWLGQSSNNPAVVNLWILHPAVRWEGEDFIKALSQKEHLKEDPRLPFALAKTDETISDLPASFYPVVYEVLMDSQAQAGEASTVELEIFSEKVDRTESAAERQARLTFVVDKLLEQQSTLGDAFVDRRFNILSNLFNSTALLESSDETLEKIARIKGQFLIGKKFVSVHKNSFTIVNAYDPEGFASFYGLDETPMEAIHYIGLVLAFKNRLNVNPSLLDRMERVLSERLKEHSVQIESLTQWSGMLQGAKDNDISEQEVMQLKEALKEKMGLAQCTTSTPKQKMRFAL